MSAVEHAADPAAAVAALVPGGRHLVDGAWVAARDGATAPVVDPSTGREIGRVPAGEAADVDAAVAAAAAAFPAWRDLHPTRRAAILHRWGTLCGERGEDIARLEALEVGQPYAGPSSVGGRLTYVAGQADKIVGASLPTATPDTLAFTVREPFGVCGCIVPWNAPTSLMVAVVGPALAAGNTIVAKPSTDAPLACLLLGALALEAGVPPGVLNLVTGSGAGAGAALARHPGVAHMSFTGSSATGTSVMEACAKNLIPLHLELGGKSPQVIFDDADLDLAIPAIVRGIVLNSGQTCAAGTRVVVQRRRRAEVVERLAAGLAATRLGAWHEQADMGPLVSAAQQRQVLAHIDAAREDGAAIVTGGGVPADPRLAGGFYVEPTLVDAATPAMRIAQEEVFGPVLAVLEFDDLDEAVAIANGTVYGLAATAWTADVGRAVKMARRLQAGQVHVNAGRPGGAIGAPFGGYKQSGFGRTMGIDTVAEFTQIKTIVLGGHERAAAA